MNLKNDAIHNGIIPARVFENDLFYWKSVS